MEREQLAALCFEQWARRASQLLDDLAQRALIVNRLPEVCGWRACFSRSFSELEESQREPFLKQADHILSRLG